MGATSVKIPGLELISPLGAGAQGSVFRARRGNEEYAVKLYRELDGGRGGSRLRHIRREAVALARVRHPTIPQILEIGVADRTHYIVMVRIPVNVITQIVDRDRSDRRIVIGAKRRWGVRLLLGGLLLSPRGAL